MQRASDVKDLNKIYFSFCFVGVSSSWNRLVKQEKSLQTRAGSGYRDEMPNTTKKYNYKSHKIICLSIALCCQVVPTAAEGEQEEARQMLLIQSNHKQLDMQSISSLVELCAFSNYVITNFVFVSLIIWWKTKRLKLSKFNSKVSFRQGNLLIAGLFAYSQILFSLFLLLFSLCSHTFLLWIIWYSNVRVSYYS